MPRPPNALARRLCCPASPSLPRTSRSSLPGRKRRNARSGSAGEGFAGSPHVGHCKQYITHGPHRISNMLCPTMPPCALGLVWSGLTERRHRPADVRRSPWHRPRPPPSAPSRAGAPPPCRALDHRAGANPGDQPNTRRPRLVIVGDQPNTLKETSLNHQKALKNYGELIT